MKKLLITEINRQGGSHLAEYLPDNRFEVYGMNS